MNYDNCAPFNEFVNDSVSKLPPPIDINLIEVNL
jgi:hypothetical protein